jgi:hypothetical protein
MNIRTGLSLVLLLTTQSICAQVLVGPVVGPQICWVAFGDKDDKGMYTQRPTYGFHAGANLSFRVHNQFFLHSSFLYSTKGKDLEGKDDPLMTNKERYQYLELPLTYTAEFITKTGRDKQFKWYLGIGPNISYWLSGKGSVTTEELSEILIEQVDYKFVFNKDDGEVAENEMNVAEANRIQLGLNVAAGLAFEPLGYHKVMVTARYEFGHSYFSRDGNGTIAQDSAFENNFKIVNRGFRLSFAYLIDLKTEERKKGKSTIDRRRR